MRPYTAGMQGKKAVAPAAFRIYPVRNYAGVLYGGSCLYACAAGGAADSVPGFVVAVSSLAIFVFTLFKAGPVFICRRGYDMLRHCRSDPFPSL